MSTQPTQLSLSQRPIRLMTVEERRAYNRVLKQRSRAEAVAKTRNGAIPTTKEAGMAVLAEAAARIAIEDRALAERLTHAMAALVGARFGANFAQQADLLMRRIAAPRRKSARPKSPPIIERV